ncbi:short-chain dehydrogenase [Amycolatopsis mediterranei]|uniref:short-chain dehydrogenase n=1 Tax=Amycolatopsis mediterranei TaxID=33910 RepID=UPI0034426FB8
MAVSLLPGAARADAADLERTASGDLPRPNRDRYPGAEGASWPASSSPAPPDGLGLAAARGLLGDGHDVVVHVRNAPRLDAVRDLLDRGAEAVVADLSDVEQTRDLAGSSQHHHGRAELTALDRPGSYPDSKLFVTTLAAAVARLRPDVTSNAVDPGRVPTKMGGPGAPDDLRLGHLTQEWLATSNDPEARGSGGYWHHRRRVRPHPAVRDHGFQDRLLETLAGVTGTRLAPAGEGSTVERP